MKPNLFLFGMLLMFTSGKGQSMVKNTSYNLVLKTLLSHSVSEISVKQAVSLSKRSGSEAPVFIDSREQNEFDVSHIKGAVWVGYNSFDIQRLHSIPKDKKLLVYCSVGYRSEKISDTLIKAGYKNVSNLYGGIFEWVNEGKTVVDNNNIATKKVHAYGRTWGIWLNNKNYEKIY